MAKNYLNQHGFKFEEIRADNNPEVRNFLIEKGHKSMPQIYHNGTLLVSGGGQALVRLDPGYVRKLIGDEQIDVSDFKL
tara:strand:+ start:304 stop:540 length:237 start_codon:yes stop_codon:yes gene_type:complete